MPELPEVEHLVRTLRAEIVDCRVKAVSCHRPEVVHGAVAERSLLARQNICGILRHGKQFALVGSMSGSPVVCVHLGMTGSLQVRASQDAALQPGLHEHVVWHFEDGRQMVFRDPRRFGGIWTFSRVEALLQERWRKLGPDAMTISADQLHDALKSSGQAVKAALLNQQKIAGLGNIYVDEILAAAGIHPSRKAETISRPRVTEMLRQMQRILNQAVNAGGSSLRDYVDAQGRGGFFQTQHRVYGRAGLPCVSCSKPLLSRIIAGRTTVYCNRCQK